MHMHRFAPVLDSRIVLLPVPDIIVAPREESSMPVKADGILRLRIYSIYLRSNLKPGPYVCRTSKMDSSQ
jgi:hypothetical protein